MSNFSYFMKANKKVKENVFHPVTASLCDANGKPLDWEFRHITSKENDEIREDCTKEIPVTGKPNLYRPHVDGSKYTKELLIKSIVTPDRPPLPSADHPAFSRRSCSEVRHCTDRG